MAERRSATTEKVVFLHFLISSNYGRNFQCSQRCYQHQLHRIHRGQKMKRISLYIGIAVVFIWICCGICYYIFHIRHMPFRFVCTMAMKGNTSAPLTFYYAPTEERFRFWMCDHQQSDGLLPLIENPDLSSFDFDKYDYLLFKGKKLKELSFSPWLTFTEDAICSHEDARTPLISTLEDASIDTLYIYRIAKTENFRPTGP